MLRGNARFVAGDPQHPRQDVERREALLERQAPHAALFGCSDSRLAAEIIFDKGLGDLFVVRNAGQVISDSVLGSLEYAVAVLNVPLIVVLGHDECGAVLPRSTRRPTDPPAAAAAHREARSTRSCPPFTGSPARAPIDPADVDADAVGREHLRDTIAELLRPRNSSATRSRPVRWLSWARTTACSRAASCQTSASD